jgi:DNA-binding CsgD family transcriptional regulator/PAS domain-containing protein
MREAEALSSTIEQVYDAATQPDLWPRALGTIAGFVNGHSAAIFAKTSSPTEGAVFHHDGRISDTHRQTYFNHYSKLAPANALQSFAGIEQPVSLSSQVAPEAISDHRFFREWAAPQGLVDFVSVTLEKTPTSAAMFGVFRHERQGIADETMLRRMSLLVPHIRRAVFIGNSVDRQSAKMAAFEDTLDGLSGALILVDRTVRIVHANAVAYHALAQEDLILARSGRLAFIDRSADDALRAAVSRHSAPSTQDNTTISLGRKDGERFMAHILPLTIRSGQLSTTSSAVAAIFVQRAALDLDSAPDIIALTYGLTPSERRVLLAIVEIGGGPDVAASLGIGEGTVKTHLRNIFAKTGATRQADLVKLVATYTSPIGGRRHAEKYLAATAAE